MTGRMMWRLSLRKSRRHESPLHPATDADRGGYGALMLPLAVIVAVGAAGISVQCSVEDHRYSAPAELRCHSRPSAPIQMATTPEVSEVS